MGGGGSKAYGTTVGAFPVENNPTEEKLCADFKNITQLIAVDMKQCSDYSTKTSSFFLVF